MSKLFSKRAIILALAVAMTAGLFAASANAAAPGYAPGVNAKFWWTNTGLTAEFLLRIQFNGSTITEQLPTGENTIQEYFRVGSRSDGFYVITTHPQYFGPDENYDDQEDAQYVLTITGLYVWSQSENRYVDCFGTGFGVIPATYALVPSTSATRGYFKCEVFAQIMNLNTGVPFAADWNGQEIYLEIPAGL